MKSVIAIKGTLRLLLVVFLLFPYLSFADEPTTTADPASGAAEFKAGEIIVKFKEGISQAGAQSLLLAEDLEILDEMDQLGIVLLSVAEGQELETIEELKRNPLVEYAEPNYVVQISDPIATESDSNSLPMALSSPGDFPPDDPYLPWQWNLSRINAFGAWDITTGSEKVIIALIDTGVDLDHPELKDKIWTNPGEIPGNGIDDDGNGFVDDVHGWDFVDWDSEPQDDHGHGTFVAGVATAETDNGILMAGVSWGVEIMAVKVLDRVGKGYVHDINGGIRYAADNGAEIIHVSGYVRSDAYSNAMQLPVNYAHSEGALVVAGSGDPDQEKTIPPDAYQYYAALDHVVSVAATDRDDERWGDSTYNEMVDVAAPGASVFSFFPGGDGYWSSTGLAAAHVSGLAALIWSVNPYLTNDQVEDIIKSTAVDLGEPGRDDYFGHGRIDAAAAVLATPHYLEIEDGVLDFGRVCDQGIAPSRRIANPYTNSSTWRAVPTDDWLSVSGPQGLTPSSAEVSIDKGTLADYGVYTAGITAISIMTNAEHSPILIPITAVYTQCWESYLPLLFKDRSPD
jgi:subtilisin family serine protease